MGRIAAPSHTQPGLGVGDSRAGIGPRKIEWQLQGPQSWWDSLLGLLPQPDWLSLSPRLQLEVLQAGSWGRLVSSSRRPALTRSEPSWANPTGSYIHQVGCSRGFWEKGPLCPLEPHRGIASLSSALGHALQCCHQRLLPILGLSSPLEPHVAKFQTVTISGFKSGRTVPVYLSELPYFSESL